MYQSDVAPLLTQYNNSFKDKYVLEPIDKVSEIRGAGLYNPGPQYVQSIDRGNAWDNIKQPITPNYALLSGNLNMNTVGAVEVDNTWEKNTNYDIVSEDGSNYKNYDEFQVFALNIIRKTDTFILPYFFSAINVKYIQDEVIKYVNNERNIIIQTKQDVNNLLQLMLVAYKGYESNHLTNTNFNRKTEKDECSFSNILGLLNKWVIEKYVENVLSTLNMTEYYFNDISKPPGAIG